MSRFLFCTIAATCLTWLAGCRESTSPAIANVSPGDGEVAALTPGAHDRLDVAATVIDDPDAIATSSGLTYLDLTEGQGPAVRSGHTAIVHYTAWLANGQALESSHDVFQPFSFTVGSAEVVPAWNEGLTGMRVGGRRRIVAPPELAFCGDEFGNLVPPDATLVFDLEVLDVED